MKNSVTLDYKSAGRKCANTFRKNIHMLHQCGCKFQAMVDCSLKLEDSWVEAATDSRAADIELVDEIGGTPRLLSVLSYVDVVGASWRGVHNACEMTQ
jgi:hypothetical protein